MSFQVLDRVISMSLRSLLMCLFAVGVATAAFAQESPPATESQFQRAELNPQARVAVQQGVAFLNAKDYKKAINAFASAVKMHPKSAQFRHLLGVAYFRNKQGGPAWLQFRRAVMINPSYAPAVRDFEGAWAIFQRKGLFAIGRPQPQIAQLIGEPDAKASDAQQEIWQYGFMRLQFVEGRLAGIVDPRGMDQQSQRVVDRVSVELDDSARWRLANRSLNRLHSLIEYIPSDQTLGDWKELFQVQRLHNMADQRSPQELMNNIAQKLKESQPGVTFAVLSQSDQEALFHWNTPGTEEQPPQHEIVRLIRGERDLHRLAYSRRVAQIPQAEAQMWLDLLRKAKLVPASSQSSSPASE